MTQSINLHRVFLMGDLHSRQSINHHVLLSNAARAYHLRDNVLVRYPLLHYDALNEKLVLAVVILRDLLGRLHRNYTEQQCQVSQSKSTSSNKASDAS